LFAVVLLAATLSPVVGVAPDACAATTPHAALVVDTGAEAERFCVRFPGERTSVSGIELIELAGIQHGLSYRLAQFDEGVAVCMLADVGRATGECLGTPYWTYWHGDGSGGWVYSSVGAGKWTVTDGAVEGWAWGGASTRPPSTTVEGVCGSGKPAPQPTPTPTDRPGPSPPGDGETHEGSAGAQGRGGSGGGPPRAPTGSSGGDPPDDPGPGAATRSREVSATRATPSEEKADPSARGTSKGGEGESHPGRRAPAAAARSSGPGDSESRAVVVRPVSGTDGASGPPPAGVIGLAASLVIAVVGARTLRRRNSRA
jgi:hypothetical protein